MSLDAQYLYPWTLMKGPIYDFTCPPAQSHSSTHSHPPALQPQIRTEDKSIWRFPETLIPGAFFSSEEQQINGLKTISPQAVKPGFIYLFVCVNNGLKVNVNNVETRPSCSMQNYKLFSLARVVIFAKGSRLHIISNKGQDGHSARKEVPNLWLEETTGVRADGRVNAGVWGNYSRGTE